MDVWYKKLGYYENPFLINPLKESGDLIAQETQLKDALYYITSGSFVFLEGERGSGKTKLLRTIIDNFRGKIIYINAAKLKKNLNIEDLLRKKTSGMFSKLPKDMILLFDNVTELSLVNIERIKYFYDQGFLRSVVFAGVDFKKAKFPESLLSRIGKRIIALDILSPEQAVSLALSRLDENADEEEPLIEKKLIKKVFEKSNKNPRMFLINLHRVFEEMHFEEDDVIVTKHLDVLNDKLDSDDEEEFDLALGAEIVSDLESMTDKKGNKLMKVGEYYRCPNYDIFCGNCGAIVKPTDVACPECKAEFENSVDEIDETGEANA